MNLIRYLTSPIKKTKQLQRVYSKLPKHYQRQITALRTTNTKLETSNTKLETSNIHLQAENNAYLAEEQSIREANRITQQKYQTALQRTQQLYTELSTLSLIRLKQIVESSTPQTQKNFADVFKIPESYLTDHAKIQELKIQLSRTLGKSVQYGFQIATEWESLRKEISQKETPPFFLYADGDMFFTSPRLSKILERHKTIGKEDLEILLEQVDFSTQNPLIELKGYQVRTRALNFQDNPSVIIGYGVPIRAIKERKKRVILGRLEGIVTNLEERWTAWTRNLQLNELMVE